MRPNLVKSKPPVWVFVLLVLLVLNLFLFFFLFHQRERDGLEASSCLIKSETRGLFSDSTPSPRIIVTGGAGFIGSHLVTQLVDLYSVEQVVVIDSLVRGKLENLEEIEGYSRLTVCVANLEDPMNANKYVKGADVVYHLAASVAGVDYVFTHEPEVFRTNILLNENVLNSAILSGAKRYFYAGTACSFPKHLQMSTSNLIVLNVDQTYPAEPESSYGWSKLMGEYEAHLAAQYGKIDVGVIRFHNVYGDHTEFAEATSQAIPALIYRALNGGNGKGELVMWGNGQQYRDFLHVSDAVSGLLAFLRVDAPVPFHETVQIGSGEGVRLLELAEYISEIAFTDFGIHYDNRRLKVLPDVSKPTGDLGRIADNQAAKDLLDWEPKVTWKKGVKMLAHWIHGNMKKKAVASKSE
mmetsp:Transcript_9006/g.12068  ORF Transcript_9006/g.12068 Transcript_9006/m.12068 type:complete len:410 (-) Transcript_9006:235-1464(-)|eukprot:CAMPEP_0201489780 /NCGR_PEP_ID=MMETSP0151_2-20130828/23688_1 /ASSEMBLY_ACC=CAM_ASM_000257 /TAXON_ID=200890 /ORGANISM="Paramoeba atlantica, Strain 621/1 / CCAP 1560/9" /LENGTH=409 /DNA_ID=CAMNT_0047875473 /DNA_START=73 /DNA_END=1302 /DNA_ORIENTATION=+